MSWCLFLTFEWLGKEFTSVESSWMVYGASLCFPFDFSVCLKMFIIKFRKSKRNPSPGSPLHTKGGLPWRPWSLQPHLRLALLTHDMLQSPWTAHMARSSGLLFLGKNSTVLEREGTYCTVTCCFPKTGLSSDLTADFIVVLPIKIPTEIIHYNAFLFLLPILSTVKKRLDTNTTFPKYKICFFAVYFKVLINLKSVE